MKKTFLSIVIVISLVLPACKHDKLEIPQPVTQEVKFVFKNVIDGAPVQKGSMSYYNAAGNNYSVDLLKYYISNIVLVRSDQLEYKATNYELIDIDSPSSLSFSVTGAPPGYYTAVKFKMGIDSTSNFSGPQNGDLDPVNGMLWDWNSGYVFFKHEGYFMDSTGVQTEVHFHYGTLKALVSEELPVSLIIPEQGQNTIEVTFNLNKIYASPNIMNFNGDNFHQSTGPGENGWVQLLKENFDGAFEITSVQ